MTTEDFLLGLNERITALASALDQMIKLREALANLPPECDQLTNNHLPLKQPEEVIEVTSNDLSGTTLTQAAIAILKESEEPLHYEEVARRAVTRGYAGRKSVFSTTRTSFWATMNRNTARFEPTGNGKYRLKQV